MSSPAIARPRRRPSPCAACGTANGWKRFRCWSCGNEFRKAAKPRTWHEIVSKFAIARWITRVLG